MKRRLFGTDGVRARANHFPMDPDTALRLGRAVAVAIKREAPTRPRVVVGKDTRLSGYIFENALIAGLCSMGVDTLMVGPLPTPGVAFITRAYRADAGIMISASHNPYQDNGIKFFCCGGWKFSDGWERLVEELVEKNSFEEHLPEDGDVGRSSRIEDADGRYLEFLKATYPRGKRLQGMRVVVDAANGAAHRVAPRLFWELGAEVFPYACQPDGKNINRDCGSLHPDLAQKAVLEQKADIGVVLDGDGDRLALVDEQARVLDGDVLMAICARQLLEEGDLPEKSVVGTVMTNAGVVQSLQELGIEVVRAPVGDRNVMMEMRARKLDLGGEQSGHLIFLRYNTTGDGLLSALQVMRIMRERGVPLSQLSGWVRTFPQVTLNVEVGSKPDLSALPVLQEAIRDVEASLNDAGRVVVRCSGTQALVRVMVEAESQKRAQSLAGQLADVVKREVE